MFLQFDVSLLSCQSIVIGYLWQHSFHHDKLFRLSERKNLIRSFLYLGGGP